MSGSSSVPSPSFGPVGFIAPAEQDILNGALADMNAALGGGMNTALETPQGQLASSLTAIIGNKNDQFVAITQGVDPAYADGRMQDGIARIYFIERNPAQPTVVQVTCTGIVGVVIPAGSLAQAVDGNLYQATTSGTIGADGTVAMSFACVTTGPIACPTASLTTIYRTVTGWDTITNAADGVVGNDVETRRAFELRRQQSVARNSVGSIPAVQGTVLNVPNVLDAYTTDNPTSSPIVVDGVTLVPNSLYVCVAGGDPQAIAKAIWTKKMPGCAMSGNATITVLDDNSGYSPPYPAYNITYQQAVPQQFTFIVRITASVLVPQDALTQIQNVILAAFAGSDGGARARIGSTVYASRFYSGIASLGLWAEIISIKIGSTGAPKAVFAASISGQVMTVTAVSSGVLTFGQTIEAPGVGANVTIALGGTGSGGTGTYNLNLPQNVSTQQMVSVFADQDVVSVGIAHVPVLAATDINVILV